MFKVNEAYQSLLSLHASLCQKAFNFIKQTSLKPVWLTILILYLDVNRHIKKWQV